MIDFQKFINALLEQAAELWEKGKPNQSLILSEIAKAMQKALE